MEYFVWDIKPNDFYKYFQYPAVCRMLLFSFPLLYLSIFLVSLSIYSSILKIQASSHKYNVENCNTILIAFSEIVFNLVWMEIQNSSTVISENHFKLFEMITLLD